MNDIASTMKELALGLFALEEKATFKVDCTFEEDPRGYAEVIGDDPFESFSFMSKGREIRYRNLTIFSDHISFISGDWEVVLKPSGDSIEISVVDSMSEEIIQEDRLPDPLQFAEYLASILKVE